MWKGKVRLDIAPFTRIRRGRDGAEVRSDKDTESWVDLCRRCEPLSSLHIHEKRIGHCQLQSAGIKLKLATKIVLV